MVAWKDSHLITVPMVAADCFKKDLAKTPGQPWTPKHEAAVIFTAFSAAVRSDAPYGEH